MKLEPYLFFNGRAEEAIVFYETHLGATREMLLRFNESPDPAPPGVVPEGFESKVMHASLIVGGSRLLISDGCDPTPASFSGFSLALNVDGVAAAERAFNALAEGGSVLMPLGKTFFAASFGMVTDRFGVSWSVIAEC
ncbi:VOC family protein [Chenggangzhangella methanolivorans]|uniref:VOC family protein n=1 Tax=Chenggangzhangella methanolivorans TaxID=1437009 RepID=A0A9E6UPM0_9HYPH|nr:VOC family protein [Chenggangzhangella methanolivorans]QZO01564.1 VOC family protein [Chenggangzhangella methanolivorans]